MTLFNYQDLRGFQEKRSVEAAGSAAEEEQDRHHEAVAGEAAELVAVRGAAARGQST